MIDVKNINNEGKPLIREKNYDELSQESIKQGVYRICYRCPSCDEKLGFSTHNKIRCFGRSSIMKSNELPKYCPYCGEKLIAENI